MSLDVKSAIAGAAQPSVQAPVEGVKPDATKAPVVEGQPAPEAPKTEEPKVEDKPKDDLSARFAALSRQEKKIQEEKRKAKELLDKYSPFEEAISKKDALSLLERAGFSINDVLDAALTKGQPPSVEDKVSTLEQKLAALQKEKEEIEAKRTREEQERQYQELEDQYRKSVTEALDADLERFELIRVLDASESVFETCKEIILSDPDSYPTMEDAQALIGKVAESIENDLQERAKKLSGAKKLKTLLGLTDESAKGEADPSTGSQTPVGQAIPSRSATAIQQQDTTLTNKSAVTPAQPEGRPRRLSREESLRQAAASLEAALRAKEQNSART